MKVAKEDLKRAVMLAEARTGRKFTHKELDEVARQTRRKCEMNGQPDEYAPILYENELRDYAMRRKINSSGSASL